MEKNPIDYELQEERPTPDEMNSSGGNSEMIDRALDRVAITISAIIVAIVIVALWMLIV